MAQEARIQTLRGRHSLLDEQLRKAKRATSTDSLDLVALKRQKLAIKDQISSLERTN